MSTVYGNTIGSFGSSVGKTVSLIDENGVELIGTVVDKITKFTATANDVRRGITFCSDAGSLVGTKDIPAYHTTTGEQIILPNQEFSITLNQDEKNRWDYTKIQCMITPCIDGPSVDKIVLNDYVYNVEAADIIANVTKNSETQSIDLNIINESEQVYSILFFTYKEEY